MDCVPCDIVDGEEGVVGGEVQGVHVAHTLTPRYLNQWLAEGMNGEINVWIKGLVNRCINVWIN